MLSTSKPTPAVYLGVLLTTFATLMYQLVLTRIFSVTMWYHFSFMAISVTMFGMTVGAVLVYLRSEWFPKELVIERMGQSATIFAILILGTFLTHLSIPFIVKASLIPLWSIAINYAILSLPFIASGVCITLALTRFPGQIAKLYAFDLVGAALGCLAVVFCLEKIDALTLVFLIAMIAALGGLSFFKHQKSSLHKKFALLVSVTLILIGAFSWRAAYLGNPVLRLQWVKGMQEIPPLYESWNAFSRIAVWPQGNFPDGWGLSSNYKSSEPVDQKLLNIDAGASTVLTGMKQDPSELEFLRFDVTNAVHSLRKNAKVLIIGVGGGRDVLSSLYFKQREILGVEINGAILETLTKTFGDFTHHLDRFPGVRLINDEARSFVTRTQERFDIIQVSLIDTWAASAAGAFVLTENALYTTEAWERMLKKLTPTGVLTFSRWYSPERPWELYRLTALAVESLRKVGIANPREHLFVVARPREGMGVATLMISPTAFAPTDGMALSQLSEEMNFEQLITPTTVKDPVLAKIAVAPNLNSFAQDFALDISPPTDDKPFFFNMLRFKDLFNLSLMNRNAIDHNLLAVTVLAVLLATVLALCGLGVVIPLSLKKAEIKGSTPYFIYFSAIGLGYMFIEISLIQRLNVFLGHPIYSMTVVLFSLLMATGLGSLLSEKFTGNSAEQGMLVLLGLCGVLGITGFILNPLLTQFEVSSAPVRILVACLVLLPVGFFMGMGFPLGMKHAQLKVSELSPWLFGMNGSMSIVGSVLAIWISLFFSIRVTYFAGLASYAFALISFIFATCSEVPFALTIANRYRANRG